MTTASSEDPSSTNNKFSDAVDRMVLRVALQEGHEGDSASPPGSAAASRRKKLLSHAKPAAGQGPLLPHELSELSLLCTMASSLSVSSSDNDNAPQQLQRQQQQQDSDGLLGFASVDGDQLVALVELLDKHVNLAVVNGSHLVSDALELLQNLRRRRLVSKSNSCVL